MGTVIGQHAGIRGQQTLKARAFHTGNAHILSLPEITVMHQQRIGTGSDRRLYQVHAGSDAGNQQSCPGPSFDLQTVWTIVVKLFHGQQCTRIINQFLQGYHIFISC